MTIGQAIRLHALGDAGIVAAIGARMYPVVGRPPGKDEPLPDHVVFRQVNEETQDSFTGEVLIKSIFQVESICDARAVSSTSAYDRAQAISDLFFLRFHGFNETHGLMGGVGGVAVGSCRQTDRGDDFDFEAALLAKVQTFEITWRL